MAFHKLLESLYRSPFGRILSWFARLLSRVQSPFMVYGYKDPDTGIFRKYTRISSSATIINKKNLAINDKVWVGHYSIIDATEGVSIGEGVQLSFWSGIFTHGSENSIRLLGGQYAHIPFQSRPGYTRGAVSIGDYTYIGSQVIILPGVTIGKGCLIGAGSLVTKDIPDYSIVVGSPGEVVGSTIELDTKLIRKLGIDHLEYYYDPEILETIRSQLE